MSYKLSKIYEKTILSNITSYPYEGDEVHVGQMTEDLIQKTKEIMVGFVTFLFTNKITLENKGYWMKDRYYTREELVNKYFK